MSTTDTDWITPGAEIVVWRDTFSGTTQEPTLTTVTKVAAKSFAVDGVEERILFDGMESKRLGSQWSGWKYRVLHPDSEQASQMFAKQRRERAIARARTQVERWMATRTRADRLAAIEALTAVED